MSLDIDLQSLLSTLASPAPAQQNYSSMDKTEPRVWYQRRGATSDLLLSGKGTALNEETYDVEVNGLDPDATANIAMTLKSSLNGFAGTMGGTQVLGMFVEDASDEYEPRGLSTDDGYHVFSFQLRVLS